MGVKSIPTRKETINNKGVQIIKETGIGVDYLKVGIKIKKNCFKLFPGLAEEPLKSKIVEILIRPAQRFFNNLELQNMEQVCLRDLTNWRDVKFIYICTLSPYGVGHGKKTNPKDPTSPLVEGIGSGITFHGLNSSYYQEFQTGQEIQQYNSAVQGLQQLSDQLSTLISPL